MPERSSPGQIAVEPELLIYAFRHALGQRGGLVEVVVHALFEHREALTAQQRAQVVAEIREAIDRRVAGAPYEIHDWRRVENAYTR